MSSPLVIVNHKMNLSLEASVTYCTEINKSAHKQQLIIASPVPYIAYLTSQFKAISFCAQNISIQSGYGPYTGEYSSVMIKSCGVNHSLVGHSDRRNFFGETDEMILQKIVNCLKADLTPIICIGESRKIRKNGNYKEFIANQLKPMLHQISQYINVSNKKEDLPQIIFAYEPIWAIGTGIIPTNDELTEVIDFVFSMIEHSLVANNVKLVYGGSINLDNIRQVLSLTNISGVLVGKASLDSLHVLQMLDL